MFRREQTADVGVNAIGKHRVKKIYLRRFCLDIINNMAQNNMAQNNITASEVKVTPFHLSPLYLILFHFSHYVCFSCARSMSFEFCCIISFYFQEFTCELQ